MKFIYLVNNYYRRKLIFYSLDKGIDYWEVLFIDNGIGFKQKIAGKIFQIFQWLNTSNIPKGTGSGLALCRMNVRHHGGNIFAHSIVNQGTTVGVPLKGNVNCTAIILNLPL